MKSICMMPWLVLVELHEKQANHLLVIKAKTESGVALPNPWVSFKWCITT
jgi:hypothetical protein